MKETIEQVYCDGCGQPEPQPRPDDPLRRHERWTKVEVLGLGLGRPRVDFCPICVTLLRRLVYEHPAFPAMQADFPEPKWVNPHPMAEA